MPTPDPTQRQRDALAAFRQADRARRAAEAASHKAHEQATANADAAHKTARQNAENTRKQVLAAAESQRQTVYRNTASALDVVRNRAQEQIDPITVLARRVQLIRRRMHARRISRIDPITVLARRVQLAEQSGREFGNAVDEWRKEQGRHLFERALGLLSSDDSTMIETVEFAQAEVEFTRRVQLAEQAGQELASAVDEWESRLTIGSVSASLTIGSVLTFLLGAVVGFVVAIFAILFVGRWILENLENIIGNAIVNNVLFNFVFFVGMTWLVNNLASRVVKTRSGRMGFALGSVGSLALLGYGLWLFA